MNKKLIWIIVVVIVTVVLAEALSGSVAKQPAERQTVKIGLALPLTGGAAFLGESARNAAQMALNDAGQTKYDYSLDMEDDAFNPAKTATVVSKFVNVDKVSAIVTFGSATSNAAAPINESTKVPRFGLASDPTSAIGDYNFIHWTPPFKEGQLSVQEMVKRGYKTISIVDTNHSGTLAVTKPVREALADTNIKIVSDDLTNVGDKDFRTIVAKIKALKPDIVLVEMFSPEIEIFSKQMKELGVKTPMTSVETFEWSNDPSLFEGMWFISDVRVDQGFSDKYKANFGDTPKPGATYVYDLVTLFIRTQEKSDSKLTPTEMRDAIIETGYDDSPIFGKIAIDNDGFFITEASVKMIKDGKAVLIPN